MKKKEVQTSFVIDMYFYSIYFSDKFDNKKRKVKFLK